MSLLCFQSHSTKSLGRETKYVSTAAVFTLKQNLCWTSQTHQGGEKTDVDVHLGVPKATKLCGEKDSF